MLKQHLKWFFSGLLVVVLGVFVLDIKGRGNLVYSLAGPFENQLRQYVNNWRHQHTVQTRLRQFAKPVERRLKPYFEKAEVKYPPAKIVLFANKSTGVLKLYARQANGALTFLREYPILAASGKLGPKRRKGDYQVPEGIYAVTRLNPNSRYHLSIKLNYPNRVERRFAKKNGISNPGSNIFIHGEDV